MVLVKCYNIYLKKAKMVKSFKSINVFDTEVIFSKNTQACWHEYNCSSYSAWEELGDKTF